MKTLLAIQVFLLLFTLIKAPNTEETSHHGDNDDNIPVEIEYTQPTDHSTEQELADITIIDEFEKNIKNIRKIRISNEDSEFIKDVKLKYWLNHSSSVEINFGKESIVKSSWMFRKPLKLIIHGWRISRIGEPKTNCIKDAYKNSQEYNVITVDWSNITSSKYYFKVARLSAKVGIILGHFLINLVKIGFVRPSDIHVIGHSIGAHIAGKCGNVFLDAMHAKIDRITGLDPASPGFKDSWFCLWRHNERLDRNDATFVDVIHTASGFHGISQPIGHVDFYPNNGKSPQPGYEGFGPCERSQRSHCRAFLYYAESVNEPLSFASWKCDSMREFNDEKCNKEVMNFMGHHANRNDEGKFFLRTNDRSPYSIYFN